MEEAMCYVYQKSKGDTYMRLKYAVMQKSSGISFLCECQCEEF